MIHIFRTGCDAVHPPGFVLDAPQGWGCHVLILVKSQAWFRFGGRSFPRTTVEPGTMVLLRKFSPFCYGALHGDYVNDWLLFDADNSVLEARNLAFDTPLTMEGRYPVATILAMMNDSFYSESPMSSQICSHLVYAILDMAAEACHTSTEDSRHYKAFLNLRKRIYESPTADWQVPLMAADLNLSRGHFLALYKRIFGTTCIHDVINSRVDLARELLMAGTLSLKEVCFTCGYASQVHFSRQFKGITGLNPREYRLRSRLHSTV